MCASACLLPVLVEAEENVQDNTAGVPAVAARMEGRKNYHLSLCA